MEYVKVEWLHSFEEEPIVFLSELGDDRYETRKIQIYRDGRIEWADKTRETATVGLSEIAFPDLGEISSQPEFVAVLISVEEFETTWNRAQGLA